jgi:hypothetical protein
MMHSCFAAIDLCSSFSTGILVICVIYVVCKAIGFAIEYYEEKEVEAAAAKKAREEAEFQQNHPELWRQRELLKLEKERMAAQQQLAEQKAKQEAVSRGVGTAVGLGRFLGWW